jgi:hypothetical protein
MMASIGICLGSSSAVHQIGPPIPITHSVLPKIFMPILTAQLLTPQIRDDGEKAERRLARLTEERDSRRRQCELLQHRERELRAEVQSAEVALARLLTAIEPDDEAPKDLAGATLLYVGGRAGQIAQLRRLAERWNATLLYHDGEISRIRSAAILLRSDLLAVRSNDRRPEGREGDVPLGAQGASGSARFSCRIRQSTGRAGQD